MSNSMAFQACVAAGNATGEVVSTDRFLVGVHGLSGVALHAKVLFETGQYGIVSRIQPGSVTVLNLESEETALGGLVVACSNIYEVPVSERYIGRVINPLGQPIDGQGALNATVSWPLYKRAPDMIDRQELCDRLPTGVTAVDSFFPVVQGQRIAVIGDAKSGKTTFLLQLGASQKGSNRIMVYVLIGKRRVEIEHFLTELTASGALAYSVVVIADIFSSLAQSYIAPYVGCAIAEYLWQSRGRDVVVVYDDLSAHAKAYREVALLSGADPGRDSYPSDMFFAHSSLLERAGLLAGSGHSLTALPVVLTPNDDITAYMPTNIMSITDGQIIFDLASFRQNIRPAVNLGLSVSRVGGRAQTSRQKKLSVALFKQMAAYRQAKEFAHFGSDMSDDTRRALTVGGRITEALRQSATDLISVAEQQLLLETAMASGDQPVLDMTAIRRQAQALAASCTDDTALDAAVHSLLTAGAGNASAPRKGNPAAAKKPTKTVKART